MTIGDHGRRTAAPDQGLKERFLGVFPGDVRENILAFSKHLWERDSDFFIFMARKAACFFDSLRELHIADVRGVALNDRVLDMDLTFLKGKRVTLVDDCVFTGTTLYKAHRAIMEVGCGSVETIALAVSEDSLRKQLLPGGDEWEQLRLQHPLFKMAQSDCVRQCHDIVRALSIIPRPYDVDFPHSVTLKVRDRDFQALLSLPGWQAVEGTSDFQRQHDVLVFSLFPMRGVLAEFYDRHGFAGSAPPWAKIRVYARKLQTSYSVRCVPIVMLPAVTHDETTRCLVACSTQQEQPLDQLGFTSPRSRYRLLQFIIAHSLLQTFSEQAKDVVAVDPDNLRSDLVDMSFGKGFRAKYRQHWGSPSTVCIPQATDIPKLESRYRLETVKVDRDAKFFARAVAPFTNLYKKLEVRTRKEVKKKGLEKFHEDSSGHSDRLNRGFPPEILFQHLQSDEIDVPLAMSAVLDRLVDRGVAVPIIVDDATDRVCYRAFRHGEDAVLDEAGTRLLLQGLKSYLDEKPRGKEFFTQVEFQKVVILLIQILLREGLLERLDQVLDRGGTVPTNLRVVSGKGHVHGLVATVESPSDASGTVSQPWYEGNQAQWLVHEWEREGYLKREDGLLHLTDRMPDCGTDQKAETWAQIAGWGLGAAELSDDDMVLLSTCSGPDPVLRALSGEIAIVSGRWRHLLKRVNGLKMSEQFPKAHRVLRAELEVFTAINSGARKYHWYVEGDFNRKINEVRGKLKKENVKDANAWTLLWPAGAPDPLDQTSSTGNLIHKCGRWLIWLNVATRLVGHWLLVKTSPQTMPGRDLPESCKDLAERAKRAAEVCARDGPDESVPFLRDVIARAESRDDSRSYEWYEKGLNTMDRFLKVSKRLMSDVQACCAAWGRSPRRFQYSYAIFIDVKAENVYMRDRLLNKTFHEAWEACEKHANKKHQPYLLPDNRNPLRMGMWVLLPGNRKQTVAVDWCRRMAESFLSSQIPYRAVVVGQLSSDDSIVRFLNSTQLAERLFFHRLAQLSLHFPAEYRNEITTVNEAVSDSVSEGDKFLAVAGGNREFKLVNRSSVTCGDDHSPSKAFEICKIRPKAQRRASKRSDSGSGVCVLLCTATVTEDKALLKVAKERGCRLDTEPHPGQIIHNLGEVSGSRVYWVQSDMGSGGSSGAALTTSRAITKVKPTYVISCGLAWGMDKERQKLGDVLLSHQVQDYASRKRTPDSSIPRGAKPPADSVLKGAARTAMLANGRQFRIQEGLLLSGPDLINDPIFKEGLRGLWPEAIGGEMEGEGITSACGGVGWIIVKGICDWADGEKDDRAQEMAATNAMEFVFDMLEVGLPAPR